MPTIHDVARKANVSIAAVSLVLNDPETPRVGAAKRNMIRAAANELGYVANGIAKALNKGQAKILGLVIPLRDPIFFNSFIAQFLSGIQSAIVAQGYHLMIYSHQAETGSITPGELRQSRFADGLIVLNTRMCTQEDQENTITGLTLARIPFVMANGYAGKRAINYVGLDDRGTGRMAGEFLAGRGHRRIGLLSGARQSPLSDDLIGGFREALRNHGIRWSPALQAYTEYDPQNVHRAVSVWLNAKQRPSALFCTEDQFVPDVYEELRRHGLRVPEDVAVLGRGNLSLGTVVIPHLTTITVPGFELGQFAAEALMTLLKNPNAKPTKVILPGILTERESV